MFVKENISSDLYNKIFITSDTHFNHQKEFIYKERGYKNVYEMNQDMISIINNTVGPDGILIHLGDFSLNCDPQTFNKIVYSLNIKKLRLLNGNHNSPWFGCKDEYKEKIDFLGDYHTFRINSHGTYVLFHFPILVWDGQLKGSKLLCGHSHGGLFFSLPQNKESKVLDCGWDVHRRPISLQEVDDIMQTKKTANLHHFKG